MAALFIWQLTWKPANHVVYEAACYRLDKFMVSHPPGSHIFNIHSELQ